MICHAIRLARRPLLALLLAAGCLVPGKVYAQYVILRNECKVSVVVQTVSVVKGVLKRDQVLVKPGEYTPKIPLDSDKVITICDGRTGRVLFRDPIRASEKPLAYGIVADPKAARVRVAPRQLPAMKPGQ